MLLSPSLHPSIQQRLTLLALSFCAFGSMELSSMPYNLRSHGRIVGPRLLRRRRAVQVDNGSTKHYRRCSSRPKPDKPFTGSIVLEDPVGKQEHERKPKPYFNPSEDPQDGKFWNERRLSILKERFPYPFKAMRHYNQNLKEEEQYKVSELQGSQTTYYEKLGFFHVMRFVGQPNSHENLPNSSSNVPTKHFVARVHEPPNRKTHVSDCQPFLDPGDLDTHIGDIIPVACEVCGFKNEAAIKKRSRALRKEAEVRKSQTGQSDPESDYDDGLSDPES